MKISYSLKSHLNKFFYLYIGAVILVPLMTFLTLNFKNKPKSYETYAVFIEADVNSQKLKQHLQELLPEDLKITVHSAKQGERSFASIYDAESSVSDLIIVTESLAKTFEKTPFVRLEETTYHSDNNLSLYDREYGLPIKNNNLCYYKDYITYSDENYYLFIRENSVHSLGIKADGKTTQNQRVLEDIYHV